MPFIQNMKIPTPQMTKLDWTNFIGGLNNNDSPIELNIKQSPDLMNVYSREIGVIETRPGIFKYATELLDNPILSIFEYSTGSKDVFLCSTIDTLYEIDKDGDTFTNLLTINAPIQGYQLNDKFYFIDGAKYREYDGTDIWEIINPAGTETKGVVTYSTPPTYTVTYRPTDAEVADAFYGDNNIDDMKTCTLLALHNKNNRCFFSGNSTYPNIVYSTDTENPYYIPVNQYVPPITNDDDEVTALYSYNDVMVFFKQNTIFGLYGDNETDYSLKECTVDTGTKYFKSVQKVGNYLFYFGTDGYVYSLYDLRTDYRKILSKKMSGDINLAKHPLYILPPNITDAIGVSYKDYYLLAISDKVLVYSKDKGWFVWDSLEPTCFYASDNRLLMSNANKYLYHIPIYRFYIEETFTATPAQTDFVLEKGYLNETDSDVEVYINSVLQDPQIRADHDTLRLDGIALVGGETVTIKYYSLPCYNDDGTTYTSYIRSKDMDFNIPYKNKQIRKIYAVAHTYKYFDSEPTIYTYVDYFQTSTPFVMENKISLFGVAVFGDSFIGSNIVTSNPILVNRRGKIISFKIESEIADEPFKFFSLSGDIEIKYN